MDLFSPLLFSICSGLTGSYHDACLKGTDATYHQIGLYSQATTFQGQLESYGRTKEKTVFGNNEWIVDGVVGAVVIAKNKKATLQLPTFGICNRFSTDLQPEKALLKWEWKW